MGKINYSLTKQATAPPPPPGASPGFKNTGMLDRIKSSVGEVMPGVASAANTASSAIKSIGNAGGNMLSGLGNAGGNMLSGLSKYLGGTPPAYDGSKPQYGGGNAGGEPGPGDGYDGDAPKYGT